MNLEYFTKLTKNNVDEYIEHLKSTTEFKRFTFLVYKLKDDLYNITPNNTKSWVEHISFTGEKYTEEKIKEFDYFQNIYPFLYDENGKDFDIDKIKEDLVSNNMYYENRNI
jgi:hypothetical protein